MQKSDAQVPAPVGSRLVTLYATALRVANVAPDIVVALGFLTAWVNPTREGIGSVRHWLLVILLEFIVIHSAAFMGTVGMSDKPRAVRAGLIVGLGLFYSLFAGGFAFAFHTLWPFLAFWLLTVNRLVTYVAAGQSGAERRTAMAKSWGLSVVLYVGGCFLTIFAPVPRLGLTPAVVAALHLPGSGQWIAEPYRAMAFGFLYFSGQAVYGWFSGTSPKASTR